MKISSIEKINLMHFIPTILGVASYYNEFSKHEDNTSHTIKLKAL